MALDFVRTRRLTGQLADSMGATELALSEEEIGQISNVAIWEKSRTDREA